MQGRADMGTPSRTEPHTKTRTGGSNQAGGQASYPAAAAVPADPASRRARASASPLPSSAPPAPVQFTLALAPQDLRARAFARLQALWALAQPRLGRRRLAPPTMGFYRGRTDAGRAHQREQRIEINEDLLERHPDAMLGETIAHELAHVLVFQLFGRRARAHGPEWQAVMREWFGVTPQRTHSFDLQGLQVRRQQRHRYHCGCREHALSTVRHRRALRGVDYRCVACQGRLRPLALPDGITEGAGQGDNETDA